MKGASVTVGLVLVLFLLAGMGFWSNREEVAPNHGIPRALRELAAAIANGDEKKLAAILEDRPDLAGHSIGDEPLLHYAARHNKPAIIAYLLKHGVDRNARGQWNGTALHWACWWGAKDAAEKLIAEGFAIEDRGDAFASTPLLWAAHGSNRPRPLNPQGDSEGTVRMLIEHGASADTYNGQGVSALSIASKEVAKVLMEHGAKPQTHPSTRPSSSALTA